MKSKTKPIIQTKSSQKVAKFLEGNALHKKDFAEMIGVTLSYVYNLIDNAIPFSTRSTTLERIATVMSIDPEEFERLSPIAKPASPRCDMGRHAPPCAAGARPSALGLCDAPHAGG